MEELSPIMLLRLARKSSPDKIAVAGLTEAVRQAEYLRVLITARAAELLAPLGVTVDDLTVLIDACIARDNVEKTTRRQQCASSQSASSSNSETDSTIG